MSNFQVHKNTFTGGLNADTDYNITDPTQYLDAANVSLVASNKFLALQNVAGTTNLANLGITSTTVMGVFNSTWNIGGTPGLPCLIIFTATPGGNITFYCFNISAGTLYTLYQAPTPSDYFTTGQGVVDAYLYPEKGQDILYFTDNYYELRKIRCVLPANYNFGVSPLLTDTNMAVSRRRAIGQVQLSQVGAGGNLLTGTYQFAYQLINLNYNQQNPYNKYTRFSLLTNPIHVYTTIPYNGFGISQYTAAGVGLKSTNQITLNILLTQDEVNTYTHFRLCAVENIYPEGASPLTASVTEVQPISQYLVGTTITGYQFKNNYQINSVPLDEVVIDTAAIDHVKTLSVKDNRLIVGGITYKNLVYDNGVPQISGGDIINQSASITGTFPNISYPASTNQTWDSFSDHNFASSYVGHFRNELYRYFISYFDNYGNFCPPVPLNMGQVTYNAVSSGFSDYKIWGNTDFTYGLRGWTQTSPGGYVIPWGIVGSSVSTTLSINNGSCPLSQPVLPSTTYQLTAIVTASAVASGSPTVSYVLLDSSYNYISAGVMGTITTTTATTYTTSITTTGSTAYIGIAVAQFGYGGGSSFTYTISLASATTTFYDMKFPDRSVKNGSNMYTVFSENYTTMSLGLQLNGIVNHPTWASGFVILRAPRQKDVLFQSPVIPMSNVYGCGPVDNYPSIAQEGVSASTVIYTSGTGNTSSTGLQASPPGPVNVLYPMALGWGPKLSITKQTVDGPGIGGGAINATRQGEALLAPDPVVTHYQIFPPSTMFTANYPYVWVASNKVQSVDAILLNNSVGPTQVVGPMTTSPNNGTSWYAGSGDTSFSASYTTWDPTYYYYDNNHNGAKPAIRPTQNTISSYSAFATGSPGTSLNGHFVMTVDNLETKGVTFGWKPVVQKCSVIELGNPVTNVREMGLTFAAGSVNYTPNWTLSRMTDFSLLVGLVAPCNFSAVEIVNIVAGLTDTRYGNPYAVQSSIFTGTQYNFTPSELATVRAGGILPKTVTVWGGDCFVSTFNYKISDTVYSVVNGQKTTSGGYGSGPIVNSWGRAWVNTGNNMCLSIPVALRNCGQYIAVVLESEINGVVRDVDTCGYVNVSHVVANGGPTMVPSGESGIRTPLAYGYNYNLSKQNNQRLFTTQDPLNPPLASLKSRIAYSNTKVYNTYTDGFDTFPVMNIYDMPELYGGITKLAIAGNDLYCIQQRGISYLPVGQRVLESSSGSNIQVHTGDIINTPLWIDLRRGALQLRAVKEAGTSLFVMDNSNQAIYKIGNRELITISAKGLNTPLRTALSTIVPDNNVTIVHDLLRSELWFVDNGSTPFTYVWNDLLGIWVTKYGFPVNCIGGGIFTNNSLYLVGQGYDIGGQYGVYSMYTGTPGNLMGTYATPMVTFSVNPNSDFGKTFDDILINSTDVLGSLTTTVYRESSLGNQQTSPLSLNVISRGEGNFRVKLLRDMTTGARLRGGKATHTLSWNVGPSYTTPVTLTSVLTQWRSSFKQF